MKLIYIANARIPTERAHGIQIMKMCEGFSSQGLKVELVIPGRKNQIKENIWQYYSQKPSFEIEYLKIIDFMRISIPRVSFWLQSRSFLKAVILFLKKEKADIIYSRDLVFVKRLSSFHKNVFYEMHSLPRSFNKNDLEKVKGIITITQGLKDALIKKGISEDKILIAPDGVDLDKFDIKITKQEARKKLNLPQDKKIALYTGHLYEWKGATVLLKAAQNFQFSISNFQNILFIFVGGTEKDVSSFKHQVSIIKLNNVLVVGHRPYQEIPYWLKAADVLILPNSAQEPISKYWTSPMKMFEYMASQRPIVTSDLPSIREVLDENNAILAEPDSPHGLAEGIKRALKNPDFSDKISAKAWETVQEYTWNKRTGRILGFMKNIAYEDIAN